MEELEYKVIGFDGDRVILGDRGGFAKAYPLSGFNFNPKIGDIVEKYEGADYVLLSRKSDNVSGEYNSYSYNRGTRYETTDDSLNLEYLFENEKSRYDKQSYTYRQPDGRKVRNKWVSFGLCRGLGYLGVHKFYEGKIGAGLLYMFTGGLFGFGWLIDCIKYLTKPTTYYYVE